MSVTPDPAAAPTDDRWADRPVVLVGLMGSGKTTIGTRLAEALARPMRDSDEVLEGRYGQSAAEQYRRYGADVLHAREAAVLRQVLTERPPPVIAAAASVVDDPACLAALADAFVVWLDAPPRVLAERIRGVDHRPHYDPDLEAMLTNQYRRRVDRFRGVADLTVDVSDTSPERTTAAVLAGLAAR
jgi:shikimate kinase